MPKPETTGQKQNGLFRKGQSGNPKGRPKGARNKATLAAQELLDGEADAITRKAIELAKAGDMQALRLCLERIIPPAKERPLDVEISDVKTPEEALAALSQVIQAVATGRILPSEGDVLSTAISKFISVHAAVEFEARLSELERTRSNR